MTFCAQATIWRLDAGGRLSDKPTGMHASGQPHPKDAAPAHSHEAERIEGAWEDFKGRLQGIDLEAGTHADALRTPGILSPLSRIRRTFENPPFPRPGSA